MKIKTCHPQTYEYFEGSTERKVESIKYLHQNDFEKSQVPSFNDSTIHQEGLEHQENTN